MFQIIYYSSATAPFSQTDLTDLLTKARENNSRLGVTGMLLYKDGNFIQLLEGEEATLKALYDTISHDPRHQGSTIILEEPVEQPLFGEWSMGFRNLNDADIQKIPGYSQFMNESEDTNKLYDPNGCWDLFQLFRKYS